MERQQWHRWIFTGLNLVALVAILYVSSRITNTGPKRVSYSDFPTELRADHLAEVQITERNSHETLERAELDKLSAAEEPVRVAVRNVDLQRRSGAPPTGASRTQPRSAAGSDTTR